MIAVLVIAANAFFCLKLLHHAVKTSRAAVHPHAQTAAALERARLKERRLLFTTVIIIGILLSLWLPYLLLMPIPQLRDTPLKYELVRVWGLALMQLNSLANPFVYAEVEGIQAVSSRSVASPRIHPLFETANPARGYPTTTALLDGRDTDGQKTNLRVAQRKIEHGNVSVINISNAAVLTIMCNL